MITARTVALVLLALLLGHPAYAQTNDVRDSPGYTEVSFDRRTSTGATNWYNITRLGADTHALTVTVEGGPSAISVSLQCSLDGSTVSSTIGTITDPAGDTVSGAAFCNYVRVNVATITGGSNVVIYPVYAAIGVLTGSGGGVGGGDASEAEQQAQTALLTTIDADTGGILTAVQLIDNAVSGAGFNITQLGGVAVNLDNGAVDTGTLRVTIGTDDAIHDTLDNIAASLSAIEGGLGQDCSHAAGVELCPSGPVGVGEAKDFDGSALPNVVTEGQTARMAMTLSGGVFAFLTNEAGTKEIGKLEDDAHATADYGMPVWTRRRDTAATSAGTEADYATLDTDALGRLWTRQGGPCEDHARVLSAAINTASSGNVEVVALNGSDLIFICAIDVVVDAAVDIQLIYGTGTACATGETDLTGPWGFAANGGIAKGKGVGPYYVVPAGNAFCIETSGAVQTSGSVTYVRTAAP